MCVALVSFAFTNIYYPLCCVYAMQSAFLMLVFFFAKICGVVAGTTIGSVPPTTLVVRTAGLSIAFNKTTAAPVSVKVDDFPFCVTDELNHGIDQYCTSTMICLQFQSHKLKIECQRRRAA